MFARDLYSKLYGYEERSFHCFRFIENIAERAMPFFSNVQSVLPALEFIAVVSMAAVAFELIARAYRYARQPGNQDPHSARKAELTNPAPPEQSLQH